MNQTTLLQGRLGNQMFIYAYARALSLRTGGQCVLSESSLKSRNITNRLDCFNTSDDVIFISSHKLSFLQKMGLRFHARFVATVNNRIKRYNLERKYRSLFSFCDLFLCEDGYIPVPNQKNILSIGYMQSEEYFADYKHTILNEFTFKEGLKASCKELAMEIIDATEPTCLHVRLGDYVKNPLHGVADSSYYLRAINTLYKCRPNATLFVFSDNIDLVKQSLSLPQTVHCIPANVDEQQTMYLGSLCKNFVISNSSFSWWMQYLSRYEDKLVIAPSRWYARPCPCDIYMDNWILEEV